MKSKKLFLKKSRSIIGQCKTISESLKMANNTMLNLDTHICSSDIKTGIGKITDQESEQGRTAVQRIVEVRYGGALMTF